MRRMSALYIADDHAGSHLLCLAEAVEAADGIDAHAHLLGDRRKVFAALHLVVEALRRVHGRPHLGSFVVAVVSQLAVDLVAGIASVVVLATFTGSNFRVALVTGQREEVVIAGDILVAEVEEKGGIEGYAAQTCLEMQMRTRASSGVAAETDGLSGTYHLVFFHQLL